MQNNMMFRAAGTVLTRLTKPGIPDKAVRKAVLAEYHAILDRAADIGSSNKLLMSYVLAAYFIAMCRCTGLTPEQNIALLDQGIRGSKAVPMMLGNSKTYFSEKNMESRREWSRLTHEHHYANDWVVDVLEKTDDYQFGLDYTECGVCKLCRDEGRPELAHYLCTLDFMLVEVIGIHLKRTMTLADGGEKCDFRFQA